MAAGSATSDSPASRLADAIPAPWRALLADAVADAGFAALAAFVEAERQRVDAYPPADLVFNALALTPPEAVRAVILGQDPYHGPGQAQGLAFSVPDEVKAPPSLRNILRELPNEGSPHSLEPWARRGVLLLNTVLTVERGKARSHSGKGWEPFTDAVIEAVNDLPGPIVFLLWGRAARAKARLIDRDRHIVHEAGHPSPLSYRHFKGRAGFTEANDALAARGRAPIDWSLVEVASLWVLNLRPPS
jgi:uracil-DNA glycosylase